MRLNFLVIKGALIQGVRLFEWGTLIKKSEEKGGNKEFEQIVLTTH